jgi:hypothetical protein
MTVVSSIPVNAAVDANSDLNSAVPRRESPDYLAGALLQSLMRPLEGPFTWSLPGTIILSLLTLGIAPLALLPRKMRMYSNRERDQLGHFCKWMREQYGSSADQLWQRTSTIPRLMFLLRLVGIAAIIVSLIAMASYLNEGGEPHDLFSATIGFMHTNPQRFPISAENLFNVWTISLLIGYGAYWLSLIAHQVRARKFVGRFNAFARQNVLQEVPVPKFSLGLRPFWLIGGAIMASNGLIWALPMMLAAGAQRRYIKDRSRSMRATLAQRVRDVLAGSRPDVRFGVPTILKRKCATQRCAAPLPGIARFCPRCGARA